MTGEADPRGPFFSTQWEREDYERRQRGEPERHARVGGVGAAQEFDHRVIGDRGQIAFAAGPTDAGFGLAEILANPVERRYDDGVAGTVAYLGGKRGFVARAIPPLSPAPAARVGE